MHNEEISNADYALLKDIYKDKSELDKIVKKIEKGYPVQYAIGFVPFLNCKIFVDERVLVPRFATELLASKLISYIKEYGLEKTKIIDICTGSGCLAIALKKAFPSSEVYSLDKSTQALNVAKKNAKENKTNLNFLEMDILKDTPKMDEFSVIVSNPPYVKKDEIVSPNTRYEPKMALYPGDDDIIFYKRILELCKKNSKDHFIIAFEIGATQGKEVLSLAKNAFKDANIFLEQDYEGYDRFVFIIKTE